MSSVRLRGHHLVCLQLFRGNGYDRAFVSNLSSVVSRTTRLPAEVVLGADDVCSACPWKSGDDVCTSPSAGGEAVVSELDARALQVLGVQPGDRISLRDAARRLRSTPVQLAVWREESCSGCTWENACMADWPRVFGAPE